MTEATLLEEEPTETDLKDLLDERPRYGSPQDRLERMEEQKDAEEGMFKLQMAGSGLGALGFVGSVATATYGLAEGNMEIAKGGGVAAGLSGSFLLMSLPTHSYTPSPTRRLRSYTMFEGEKDQVREMIADSDHVEHDYDEEIIAETEPADVYDRICDDTELTHAIRTYEQDDHTLYDLWITAESQTEIETIRTETDDGRILEEQVEVPSNPIEDGETYHFAGVIDDTAPYLDDIDTIHGKAFADAVGYEDLTI